MGEAKSIDSIKDSENSIKTCGQQVRLSQMKIHLDNPYFLEFLNPIYLIFYS